MNILSLVIQLVSGAAGGNVAGGLLKQFSLGPIGNSIVGILGGALGGQILGAMLGVGGGTGDGLDIASILSSVGGGAAGGGVLMAFVGTIRSMIDKTS